MNIGDHLFSYAPNDDEVRYRKVGNSVAITKNVGAEYGYHFIMGPEFGHSPPYFVF